MLTQKNLNSIPTLRDYQREDVEFLKQNPCMACFNEQRTGKTPTAITTFVEQRLIKTLIVCPASAIYPWAEEYERWARLPALAVAGTKKTKEILIQAWNHGALVVSYDSLKATARSEGLLPLILAKKPDSVIIDEAHRIKDRTSANARAAFALSKIKYRLALTGTPASNKAEEIWSILHFLYPKEFRGYWPFIETYFNTQVQYNPSGKPYTEVIGIKPDKKYELQTILNKIATQRKRKDIMKWLPEKEPPTKILLPATPLQLKYLNDLKHYFETEHVVTQGVLDRLIRYRQICLHPALLDLKGESPKLDWIKDYFKDYPDRPTIIFSKFTSFIHLLTAELTNIPHRVIVGSTPIRSRNDNIKAFQNGACNLIIINIDAGKEALTLDRAEAIIFTDKFPPVGDIEQAEARFIATTPDRADKPKVIYELIMKGTYDEQLYKLLEQRAAAIDAINNFKKYMKGE